MADRISLEAVDTVALTVNGRTEVDIKRYAKVEKIPGGSIEESQILRGEMVNKDVTHPKMKGRIENLLRLFVGVQEGGISDERGNLR